MITVCYSYLQQGVIVHTADMAQQRIFGGYPEILNRYRELADNFSDAVDFATACQYFTLSADEYETYKPR